MQKNNQQVTIVHIFSPHPSPTPLGEGGVQSSSLTNSNNIVNLIESNAVFLAQHNVEYIILDNLNQLDSSSNSDYLLKNISQLPSFRNNKLIYVKIIDVNY